MHQYLLHLNCVRNALSTSARWWDHLSAGAYLPGRLGDVAHDGLAIYMEHAYMHAWSIIACTRFPPIIKQNHTEHDQTSCGFPGCCWEITKCRLRVDFHFGLARMWALCPNSSWWSRWNATQNFVITGWINTPWHTHTHTYTYYVGN